MAVDLDAGERAFRVVIKKRRFVRIEPAEGTEPQNGVDQVTDMTPDEERTFAQSDYGLRPILTIYETDTQKPNTCYIVIGRKKLPVPCS
jgi:hypothetical protein